MKKKNSYMYVIWHSNVVSKQFENLCNSVHLHNVFFLFHFLLLLLLVFFARFCFSFERNLNDDTLFSRISFESSLHLNYGQKCALIRLTLKYFRWCCCDSVDGKNYDCFWWKIYLELFKRNATRFLLSVSWNSGAFFSFCLLIFT